MLFLNELPLEYKSYLSIVFQQFQEGVEYLHEVGFPFEELNASSIYDFQYHSESSSIHHELPMVARGISRRITDQWLLDESQKRGAHIYAGTRVIGYQRRDDLFEIETKEKSRVLEGTNSVGMATRLNGTCESTRVRELLQAIIQSGRSETQETPRTLPDKTKQTIPKVLWQVYRFDRW